MSEETTRTREALRLAARDFYANSWRLVAVNATLGLALVLVGALGAAVHAALVLVVLAGPLAAALAHCAVVLQRTGNLTVRDGLDGLRLHWRRGLGLGAGGAVLLGLGTLAIHVYARHALWPLAFAALYVLAATALYGLLLLLLAVAEPERPLAAAARQAAVLVAARPGATLGLGLALLAVNVLGLAAAVMPFLTLTVGYSFVAAAHFALPRPVLEEA